MASKRSYGRAVVLAMGLVWSTSTFAQESAYADLDACTKGEQIRLTAKGAFTGLLAGFGGAMLTGNKDKAAKSALIGAAGGGAIGFATAYYTAIDTCRKINPTWITESELVRDPNKSYAQVKKENNYQPRDGVVLKLHDVVMQSNVRPGERVPIDATYDVMTPYDAETKVEFRRKLFVTVDGKESEMLFPQGGSTNRTVEAGRSTEKLMLPISSEATRGSSYRVEISAGAAGGKPVTSSKTVTII